MVDQLLSRRQFHRWGLLGLAASLTGCGTLMYPERRGQGRTGGIDWTVAGMDAIGLVFFFVPGVIAFAVDYYNGTLFFPESGSAALPRKLQRVSLPSRPVWGDIVGALRSKTDAELPERPENYITERLSSIDDFWKVEQTLMSRYSPTGDPAIRCQSPE